MEITFYGVRGSTPVPNANMTKYGGNTACVHLKLSDGTNIIFDSGTGIRQLGRDLSASDDPIHILLSHSHWDHVIGYPFFQPIYQKDREIHIYPSRSNTHDQLCSLLDQMDGAHFPISARQLPSKTRCVIADVEAEFKLFGLNIQRKLLNHPGGGFAYRVEDNGSSCAFVTDNELPAPDDDSSNYQTWVDFCRGADVLIHDAQYLDNELVEKQGWGHSILSRVWQLALDAQVKTLVLFHHDPDRTDTQIDNIQQESRSFFRSKKSGITSICAFEGLTIDID